MTIYEIILILNNDKMSIDLSVHNKNNIEMSSSDDNNATEINYHEHEIEIEIDNIRTHLTNLHEKADAIGSELKIQEGIVDEANISIEESLHQLNRSNKKMTKLTNRNTDKAKCLCLLTMVIAVVIATILLIT